MQCAEADERQAAAPTRGIHISVDVVHGKSRDTKPYTSLMLELSQPSDLVRLLVLSPTWRT